VVTLGIAVFLWIVFWCWSLRRGQPAPDNPWGSSTLEWAASSPPASYNFRTMPSVRGLDPLWEEEQTPADGATERLTRALAEPRGLVRETIGTAMLDARPEQVIRLPGPSHWPLVLASGIGVVLVGFLLDNPVNFLTAVAAGVLISIVAVIGWAWPGADERLSRAHPPAVDEALPTDASGARSTGWWGMVLLIAALVSLFGHILFAYFLIRNEAPAWPPPGIPLPDLLLMPLPGSVALLVAGGAGWWYERAVRRGSRGNLLLGLAAGIAMGLLFLGLLATEFVRQEFTPQTNVYGSLFFVVLSLHATMVLVGLGMSGVTLARTWLGHFTPRRYLGVQTTAIWWYFTIAVWIAVVVTLYVTPHVW
jgi:cytochrome c oxidase subunit I+III